MAFRTSPKKLDADGLFDYAVRALERRALTAFELRRKLKQRAEDQGTVEPIVERLRGLSYIDDARTAEAYTSTRKDVSLLGRRRVLADLRRRGVDAKTAEKTVEDAFAESDELALIREHLRRKLGRRVEERTSDQREVTRLYRGLLRAGFSSGKIGEALRAVSADAAWIDGVEDELAASDPTDT